MSHTRRNRHPFIARLQRLAAFGIAAVAAVSFIVGIGVSAYGSRVSTSLATIQTPGHASGAPAANSPASLPAGLTTRQEVDVMALGEEQARTRELNVRAAAAMAERAAQAEPRGGSMALAVEQAHTQALQRKIAEAYAARLAEQAPATAHQP